jgi:UDP-3-O-[3-hydroxymyristoyl] N-acetylglucosamine deacetylase
MMQKTIVSEVFASGVGLFTGEKVSLKLLPAAPNTGIIFERVDLPGRPKIPALLSFVRQTPRCTRLATDDAGIIMVEHLLSALGAMGVDNVKIEVDGPEILAADGSAKLFVDLIEKAGLLEQGVPRKILTLSKPIYWSEGEVHIVALPAEEFRLSYMMHYPQSSLLGSQYYSAALSPQHFKEQIAPSRTFSLYEEILPFIERGMIKGGGLDNALVIKGDQIMNPEGARFADEMVRHKVLDLNGDLVLLGVRLKAHIISVCSGHSSNIAFAQTISQLECL